MATRFGWGKNGGDSLGDVRDALAGRSFGSVAPVAAYTPTSALGTTIDCSLGSDFYVKVKASSVLKIGTPTNFDDGSEVFVHIQGITTGAIPIFSTGYSTIAAAISTATGKMCSYQFRYVGVIGKWVEVGRTQSALTTGAAVTGL